MEFYKSEDNMILEKEIVVEWVSMVNFGGLIYYVYIMGMLFSFGSNVVIFEWFSFIC